jgi:uncharacterized membrane protein
MAGYMTAIFNSDNLSLDRKGGIHICPFFSSGWLTFVPEVEKRFTHAVGNRESLKQLATRFNRSWLRGQGVSIKIYQFVGNH